MRKAKDSFQIVPVSHSTLGVVYALKEGNMEFGKYASAQKAEQRKLQILATREEIKVINESAEVEFKIEQ